MVTVYTTDKCVQCNATKRKMYTLGVEFQEVAITDDLREKFKAEGFMSAPIVEAGEERWAGFNPDRIEALAK